MAQDISEHQMRLERTERVRAADARVLHQTDQVPYQLFHVTVRAAIVVFEKEGHDDLTPRPRIEQLPAGSGNHGKTIGTGSAARVGVIAMIQCLKMME